MSVLSADPRFRSASPTILDAGQRYGVTLNKAAKPRQDMLHRHFMTLSHGTSRRVASDQKLVAALVSLACSRFHANLSGYAAEHDAADAAPAQLQVKFSAVERTPVSLGNQHVARLPQAGRESVPSCRKAAFGERRRFIHPLAQHIGAVRREA